MDVWLNQAEIHIDILVVSNVHVAIAREYSSPTMALYRQILNEVRWAVLCLLTLLPSSPVVNVGFLPCHD